MSQEETTVEFDYSSVISFHSLLYAVQTKSNCFAKPKEKLILHDINGIFKPGMNAILGPTGSGKTSLLDIVAGRKDPSFLSGMVLINGSPQPENFKCITGYVVQEDVVMGTLTVRENLTFSAALRLPPSVTALERKQKVQVLIEELGLNAVAESKVGTQLIRGISGGERKRTNIGMELIISPQFLFLDEPTTGLDASTAWSVMLYLHQLSKSRTIVFSIHQPRFSISKLFDSITLLSVGEMVYHGPASNALPYFTNLGYVCEMYNNPLDFFLDIITGDVRPENETKCLDVDELQAYLVNAYKSSQVCEKTCQEIQPFLTSYQAMQDSHNTTSIPAEYQSSFFRQMKFVSQRTLLNLTRNPQTSYGQLGINILFALVVGAIYFQINADLKSGIQNRVGVFFFVTMNMIFGNMGALELFINERVVFVHENAGGFYRVSVYFLSKIFCDIVPLRIIPVMVFCAITYFMIGLAASPEQFFFFTLDLILVAIAGSSIAFFYSASVSIFALASMSLALTYVLMMVFAGLLVNLDDMGDWLNWLKYLSIFRYSINALSINEMKDMLFCNSTIEPRICTSAGNKYLEQQGVPYETAIDLWYNQIALAVATCIFLFLTYVQMRRINKFK